MYIDSPNMNLKVPIVGITEGTKWAEYVNVSFEIIDSHDHSQGRGQKITQSGIRFNNTFDWASQGGENCSFIAFSSREDDPQIRSLYFKEEDLYVKTGSGGVVRLTLAGGFNSQLLGGIGGDYITSGALVSYDSFLGQYLFESDASGIYANIQTGSITVYQQNANVLDFEGVTLQANNTTSTGYTYTFPASLPGSLSVVRADSAGNWSYHDFDQFVLAYSDQNILGVKTFLDGIISNVTGNLTGDVLGDVTGNLTGNVLGDVTGNVLGDVTGNVTGDLFGNADTATTLQTTRTIADIPFNGSADIDIPHNNTVSIQGGNATERFHLSQQEQIEATREANASQNGLLNPTDWSVFNAKVEEAPSDDRKYLRRNAIWEIATTPEVAIDDVLNDSRVYVRAHGLWVALDSVINLTHAYGVLVNGGFANTTVFTQTLDSGGASSVYFYVVDGGS